MDDSIGEQTKSDSTVLGTKAEISLYADGSFCHEAAFGSWAFTAPELTLDGVGSAPGPRVTRFEFLAVLHGLEAILAADQSDLPIRVISDCPSTVALIAAVREGRPLKRPQRYTDRADLFPRLRSVLDRRRIHATIYAGGSQHHQACHRKANRRLREEMDANPGMRHRSALIRQRTRLDSLIREREPLFDRLAKLGEEIAVSQVQIRALESAMGLIQPEPRRVGIDPLEAEAAAMAADSSQCAR